MIVGNGQLAKVFKNSVLSNTVIFASGVSNSNTTDIKQFEREKNLLLDTLKKNKNKKIVYFSSCALSAPEYKKNDYYNHKQEMEDLIKNHSQCFYIFRVPQLFGPLKHHKTLINFLYESILNDQKFQLYDEAYRYVIEINDVKEIVEAFLKFSKSSIIIDIANPHKYKVTDIVNIFEKLLNKKSRYTLIEMEDNYSLNLSILQSFIIKYNLDFYFGEEYLERKLKKKIQEKDCIGTIIYDKK